MKHYYLLSIKLINNIYGEQFAAHNSSFLVVLPNLKGENHKYLIINYDMKTFLILYFAGLK